MASPYSQREFALQVVCQLRDAGYEALWAGGCVRDQLLGLEPKDYDVATSAHPEQVRELFTPRRTLAIGAAFGVVSVLGRRPLDPIEVATFRSDGAYLDGRHPTTVEFTSAEQDALRRDFTINGMFFDPLANRVVDYVNGQADLDDKIVRAIGDPQARFAEDKLRTLRAVRFATSFGFEIESSTLAAVQASAANLTQVSAERIGAEMRRILVSSKRSRGLQLLHEAHLLEQIIPQLASKANASSSTWQETLDRLARLATESFPVALAAMLLELENKSIVNELASRLRLTNKEVARTAWLIEQFPHVESAATMPWPKLQRLLVHDGAAELVALARAVWGSDHPSIIYCCQRLALPREQLNPPPLVTGDDLVAHGLEPGPHFAKLLERLRDAQLEGLLQTQLEALEQVDRWRVDESPRDT